MQDDDIYDKWTEILEKYGDILQPKQQKSMRLSRSSSPSLTSKEDDDEEKEKEKERKIYDRAERAKSELSVLHQRYKTLTSANMHREFNNNVNLWHEYHRISERNEESFPTHEIPRNLVIAELEKIQINANRKKNIVDMGCGMAHIAKHFYSLGDARFTFYNYDHCNHGQDLCAEIAVHAQDIAAVPLSDAHAEIAVLCLAMWGSNCRSYVAEAYRLLETGGRLYMVEPTRRWSEKDAAGNMIEGNQGNLLQALLLETGFHIISKRIEKFSLFVCSK